MVELTVISTFAGCGGSSLGYKLAGFKELLAINIDQNSKDTFELNFPDITYWKKDICKVTVQEILDFCKIKKGELDVLDGNPPCQGFSTAGKRKVTDKRNDLFQEFIRLIKGLQPKFFVMENVPGMASGIMKGRFKEIFRKLKETGYNVRCKMLNAKYYGVPQSRKRIFFIGTRKDIEIIPEFPIPNKKIIPVKQALTGLINTEKYHMLKHESKEMWHKLKYGGFNKVHPKGHWYNQIKLNPNQPSPTISKTVWCTGGSGLIHYNEPRFVTITELKRIATFPDDFKLTGKFQDQWARLGNAVMPLQMKAIAETIKKQLLDIENRK